MKITIDKPLHFQGQGRRGYQEDRFKIADSGRYVIVCDGMGGHGNGDIAAQTVCCALAAYFETKPPENQIISTKYFDRAVHYAYGELDKNVPDPDALINMGTTMTCVYFGDNGALVAHTGDSRIFQIRPKYYSAYNYKTALQLETKDHSLVQQLVDQGKIKPEDAKKHPKRNIITKCMTANSNRDMPEYDSKAVIEGDYFFLCSDGVLENITTEILCVVLHQNITDEEKIQKLLKYCDNKTSDNFTAVLVHVTEGYLSPIDVSQKKTEPQPTNTSTYNTKKTKDLLKKISDYLEKFVKK